MNYQEVILNKDEKLALKKCPDCDFRGTMRWNPHNNVIQCHNCGQVIIIVDGKDAKEKVVFT